MVCVPEVFVSIFGVFGFGLSQRGGTSGHLYFLRYNPFCPKKKKLTRFREENQN